MTVRELKKALEGFDDDDQVVMSKDGEGNDYSPLSGLTKVMDQSASLRASGSRVGAPIMITST